MKLNQPNSVISDLSHLIQIPPIIPYPFTTAVSKKTFEPSISEFYLVVTLFVLEVYKLKSHSS